MSDTYDNLLNGPDAAAYLSVHYSTLLGWRQRGVGPNWVQFPSYRGQGFIKRRVAYRISDLNAFAAAYLHLTARLPNPRRGPFPAPRPDTPTNQTKPDTPTNHTQPDTPLSQTQPD